MHGQLTDSEMTFYSYRYSSYTVKHSCLGQQLLHIANINITITNMNFFNTIPLVQNNSFHFTNQLLVPVICNVCYTESEVIGCIPMDV